MSGVIVTCSMCNKRGLGAKPSCGTCARPLFGKRPADPMTQADLKYLEWKRANGQHE